MLVVGDNVHDAPALASGDADVAMGALGRDVALKTARASAVVSRIT